MASLLWSAAAATPLWLSAARLRASQSGVVAPLGLATALHMRRGVAPDGEDPVNIPPCKSLGVYNRYNL